MGSKCAYCPERRPWMLEFHHTRRPDRYFSGTSRLRRIRLWARDWGCGILVLACGKCNKQQGQPERDAGDDEEPIPDF